jgi:hypothetical protein
VWRPDRRLSIAGCLLVTGSAVLAAAGPSPPVPGTVSSARDAPAGETGVEVAFGGDVLLGAEMNSYVAAHGAAAPLAGVPELKAADVAIVNLESVVAPGADVVDTGDPGDYYFLGRPEMLGVLEAAGIDLVSTGNNHARDYGSAALAVEDRLLTAMGLAHPGIGPDQAAACAPAYLVSGQLRIAVISVNTAEPAYEAGADVIGTCHVAPDDLEGWRHTVGPAFAEARSRADVVLAMPHFRASLKTVPHPADRAAARLLIDMGADAVLGDGAHALQGIEVYQDRPIIHNAGSLVFDFPDPGEAAVFLLDLGPAGVERVRTVPLVTEFTWTRPAEPEEASATLTAIDARSRDLGTSVSGGRLELAPPTRDPPTIEPEEVARLNPGLAPGPVTQPPAVCTAAAVPDDAAVAPVAVGPLTLVGARVDSDRIEGPRLIWLETFWRTDRSIERDLSIAPHATPERGTAWQGLHEPCDWAWPTSRWAPGVINRDRFPLRPTPEVQRLGGLPALLTMSGYGPLAISVEVRDRDRSLGESGVLRTVVLDPATRTRLIVLAGAAIAIVLVLVLVLIGWRRRRRQAA